MTGDATRTSSCTSARRPRPRIDKSLNQVGHRAGDSRAPLSTLPFLQVNATAAYRTTFYSESLSATKVQIEEPVTRTFGDLRLEVVGPVFSRVFNPNNAIADRMKHVFEPSFAVSRRTDVANQDRIPTATAYDTVIGASRR